MNTCYFCNEPSEILIDRRLKKTLPRNIGVESSLIIILDNDCTSFYDGEPQEDEYYENTNEIEVSEANGYYDIEKLYQLLFPKANTEWC